MAAGCLLHQQGSLRELRGIRSADRWFSPHPAHPESTGDLRLIGVCL